MPLLVGAVLLPMIGNWRRSLVQPLAHLFLAGFLWLAWEQLRAVMSSGPIRYELAGWKAPIGIEFHADMLSAFITLVIAAIAFLGVAPSSK